MDLVGNALAIFDGGKQGKNEQWKFPHDILKRRPLLPRPLLLLLLPRTLPAGSRTEAGALVDQGHARIRSKMMFIAPFTFAMLESLQEW